MRTNTTKAKLKAGETVLGSFVRTPDPSIIEFLGYQGWDFLTIDAEHGTIDPQQCEQMVRAAELTGVTPLVRVTTNQPPILLRFLDTGAQGVHVPWVNTQEQAEQALQSIKYQPRGIRGLAGVRAMTYGQTMNYAEYVEKANAETLTVIQVETAEAVNNVEAILNVKDIDVLFVGRTDLSHSLGVPGQVNHPTVEASVQHVADALMNSDVALGMVVGNSDQAREWRDRGARYIITGLEAILGPACRSYLASVRE
jgi:4-hydroxy-2-oxoheptanedioate aldolase